MVCVPVYQLAPMCVEVFDVSSEWFNCTEPSRTSSTLHYKGGSLVAFSPFLTLSVVIEPLYTTMRNPLECVETHRLVISRFCQLLDQSVVKIDRNLASKPSTRHHSTPTVSS